MGPFAVAEQYLAQALADAEALGRRSEVHVVALRLVELAEQADYDECNRLAVLAVIVVDPPHD